MHVNLRAKTCTVFTNYNHDDTAILDFQLIHFYKLMNAQEETRKDENNLSDPLNGFHHWLASEISESLNGIGYFSKLHDGAEIQFLTLKGYLKSGQSQNERDIYTLNQSSENFQTRLNGIRLDDHD